MRRLSALALAGVLVAAAGPAPAPGGTPPTAAATSPQATAPAAGGPDAVQGGIQAAPMRGGNDPVVASVEGTPIYLSDMRRDEQSLPPDLRNMPFEALFPILLNRMVDQEALVMLARRDGLENNPEVQKQVQAATDSVLESALLQKDAAPKVTDEAIRARYDQLYGNAKATEEVHARHILVGTEAEADRLIAELKAGADFATLAKKYSEDPDGQKGGDLGFFTRNQVEPDFADVVFSMQPGQVASQPIHNEFGWHVVEVLERRLVAPPAFDEVKGAIRTQLEQEAIRQEVALARGQFTIHEWNLNGSPINPPEAAVSGTAPRK